jgi:hypothetical protein
MAPVGQAGITLQMSAIAGHFRVMIYGFTQSPPMMRGTVQHR